MSGKVLTHQGLRGFVHTPLQRIDLLLELVVLLFEVVELVLKLDDIMLDQSRRVMPILLRKGQGPERVVGAGLR